MNTLERLRGVRESEALTASEVFDAIFEAGGLLAESEREDGLALEIAIRLLEARRLGKVPDDCLMPVEYLAEECGLYPYVETANFGHLTQTIIEAHSVNLTEKRYLHAKQMQTLLWLLNGDNVILSAPTSFGKSLLVDAFISMKRPHTVVMLLPTIALIDEARRRLTATFRDTYEVISTTTDLYSPDQPTIFILTQERFLQRKDDMRIGLLFIDEFYKLDPDRSDDRYQTLNLALYRAVSRARQCFMAGPHIRSIDLGPSWSGNFRFVQTDYRTVTVNVIDRTNGERLATFLNDLRGVGNESSLVFTATPGSAHNLVSSIIGADLRYDTELGRKLGDWIASNYHCDWRVAEGTTNGIAVHHGRVPRSLAQLFVTLFDRGELKVLVCTSTLIEGVNTAAANVFIYDKKISRTDFDFFSFTNIRGRVGRMMRHFVGNAFLYHDPPAEVETGVTVPVFSDPGASTDFLVMNVEREELSRAGQLRQDRMPAETGLSRDILREHSNLGVELLVEIRDRVEAALQSQPSGLRWTGYPNKEQRVAVAELALHITHARRDQPGLHSPKQIGWAWSQLRQSRSIAGFLRWFARVFKPEAKSEGVDVAFQFLQACEFTFPRSLAAISDIVNLLDGEGAASYGLYLTEMENWFRPPWIKQLDEAGIPVPLGERLRPYLRDVQTRAQALASLRNVNLSVDAFDDVDRFILKEALQR